jgi:hypothetical protein
MKRELFAAAVSVLVLGATVKANASASTSEEAVRNFLTSSPRPDRVGTHSQVGRIITVANTPTNVKVEGAQTQGVYYKVEVTLPDDYVARRITYLKYERAKGTHTTEAINRSLERMKKNRQIVQGRALVKKTSNGWEVLDARSINSRLDSWALDIYYTG